MLYNLQTGCSYLNKYIHHFLLFLKYIVPATNQGQKRTITLKSSFMNSKVIQKRSQRKYNLPVIGHFADKSVRFSSIVEAERITGINYNLIFEACIGMIYRAGNALWEFEKGNHYIKYKASYLRARERAHELENRKDR